MNQKSNDRIPPELREHLAERAAEDQESLEKVWNLLGEHAVSDSTDVDSAWASLKDRIPLDPAQPRKQTSRAPIKSQARRGRIGLKTGLVGLVGILLCAGVLGWWSSPVEVTVVPGERTVVMLPDGSSAILSGGSSLVYRRGFARIPGLSTPDRLVHFAGEAFFEIQEDERPFIVETTNTRIEVLGTSFDVQAWDQKTTVVLSSGSVQMTSRGFPDEPVTLHTPGDRSRVIGDTAVPTTPENPGYQINDLWDQQGFYASRQPIADIVRRLEMRYGKRIILNSATAGMREITLYYPQAVDLEVILNDICMVSELRYRPINQGYELIDAEIE